MEDRHLVVPALEPWGLHNVPPKSNLKGWLIWREACVNLRQYLRNAIRHDEKLQSEILEAAARDPVFWLILFGVIHEPRNAVDLRVRDGQIVKMRRRKGWYPWIPYPFQVQVIRTMREILDQNIGDDEDWWEEDESGKGDIVIEKSRDMGATWTVCAVAAHDWLFGDEVFTGVLSRKEDMVDSNNPGSMFYKIEALIGIFPKIPKNCISPGTFYNGVEVALPEYLIPAGLDVKEHDQKLNLIHPFKNNQIIGEATTSQSGIGSRTNYNIIDEGAKIKDLEDIWEGMGAVTDHRIVLGSADRRQGDGMFNLASQARRAMMNPGEPGPTLITLSYRENPMFTEAWAERQRKRLANRPHVFAREYEIDWNAGLGSWVYPAAKLISPTPNCGYHRDLGDVLICIDPGIRDPTAIGFLQYDPRYGRWNLFDGLVVRTPSARDIVPLLMGWPEGHPLYQTDALYEDRFREISRTMWQIWRDGKEITFVGDPYGTNRGGGNSESYYLAMFLYSETLMERYPEWNGENMPDRELTVMVNFSEAAREHVPRKEALTNLLPDMNFNDAPGPRQFLYHVQNHRYKEQEEGRLVQNEPTAPAHDEHSHAATALEFAAVHIALDSMFDAVGVGASDTQALIPQESDFDDIPNLQPVAM